MNNRGQEGVGKFIMLFIGVIVALALFLASIQNTNDVVNLGVVSGKTINLTSGAVTVLTGKLATGMTVTNATSGGAVSAGNYTVVNNDVSTGTIRSTIQGVAGKVYADQNVNLSYTYEPLGYAEDAGSRSVTNMIAIFAALAIMAYVLFYAWKNWDEIF